jgi:hypothetical protein
VIGIKGLLFFYYFYLFVCFYRTERGYRGKKYLPSDIVSTFDIEDFNELKKWLERSVKELVLTEKAGLVILFLFIFFLLCCCC